MATRKSVSVGLWILIILLFLIWVVYFLFLVDAPGGVYV